jgi:AAA family ATP:ADP antiporter
MATPPAANDKSERLGALERILRPFAEVHDGEGGTAILLTINVFLLLLAYYVLKVVREPLILGVPGGAEAKSNASAYQAFVLIFVVQAYNWLSQRVSRIKLITAVYVFFTSNLGLFYLAGKAGLPGIGVAFFIWVGVFSMFAVASFWSFAADVYTPDQGKRIFAIVGIGSSSGAVAGSFLAGRLKGWDPFQLMLLAAVHLVVCLVI